MGEGNVALDHNDVRGYVMRMHHFSFLRVSTCCLLGVPFFCPVQPYTKPYTYSAFKVMACYPSPGLWCCSCSCFHCLVLSSRLLKRYHVTRVTAVKGMAAHT